MLSADSDFNEASSNDDVTVTYNNSKDLDVNDVTHDSSS